MVRTQALTQEADAKALADFVRQCLTRPSHYGYSGDLDLFRTWGFIPRVGNHRDGEPIDRANHAAALALLKETLPETDFEVVHSRHWAVGWTDEIAARLLEADGRTPTKAATVAFNLCKALDDYPVLDEDLLSEEEQSDLEESWDGWGRSAFRDLVAKALGTDWTGIGNPPAGDGDPWLDLVQALDRDSGGNEIWGTAYAGEPNLEERHFTAAIPELAKLLATPAYAWVLMDSDLTAETLAESPHAAIAALAPDLEVIRAARRRAMAAEYPAQQCLP